MKYLKNFKENEEYDYEKDEFEVGDKVIIRDDLENNIRYGNFKVNIEMLYLRGKTAIIIEKGNYNSKKYYKIELDNDKWFWTKEMFLPLENIGDYEVWEDETNEE